MLFIQKHEKLSQKYNLENRIWKRIYSLVQTLKSETIKESCLWINFLEQIVQKLSSCSSQSHVLMASIGDIYRYLTIYLNQNTTEQGIYWYQKAIMTCPKNGN